MTKQEFIDAILKAQKEDDIFTFRRLIAMMDAQNVREVRDELYNKRNVKDK